MLGLLTLPTSEPNNRKLRGEFPKVVEVPDKVRAELKAKFPHIFNRTV